MKKLKTPFDNCFNFFAPWWVLDCHEDLRTVRFDAALATRRGGNGNKLASYEFVKDHRGVLYPDNVTRLVVDVVCAAIILIEALLIPFSLTFDVEPTPAYSWTAATIFTVDIIMNFFTG